MVLYDDNHLTPIEKYFITVEHLSLDIARKLSRVYEEWMKPEHGKYNDWNMKK